MLLNIPKILSPELLKKMCEMGHGGELIIADANFPATDCVTSDKILFIQSVNNIEMLEAILLFFPLDQYGENIVLMNPDAGWDIPPIWQQYEAVVQKHQAQQYKISKIGRFPYYERAKKAHVIIVTGEQSPYANIILKKGVIQN